MPRPNLGLAHQSLLLIGLVGALLPAEATAGLTSKETRDRSQEIADMTAIDRDRLQRNWQAFLALPEERRQHFRQLQQQLEADRKTGGGQLAQTLQTYALWLQTLTPGQRADLRDAKDPALKLELVKKFKEEQAQRQESRALDDPAYDPRPPRDKSFAAKKPRPGGRLEAQELRAAINALAGELPRSDREELDSLDPAREKWSLYRRVLERSLRQAGGQREWPTPEQQHAIRSVISDKDHANRLERMKDEPLRRTMFVRLMINSLMADLATDSAPFHPKPGDLETIFEQLDNIEREKLMELTAEEMNQALLQKFLSQNNDPIYLDFTRQRREFHEFSQKLFREMPWGGGRFGPGGGDRPSFRPGGPPPGGPEGEGGPNRPPRDRNGRPRPPDRPEDRTPPPK